MFRRHLSRLTLPWALGFTPDAGHGASPPTRPEVRPEISLPFRRFQSQLSIAVQETGARLHNHWEVLDKSFC